MSTWLDPQTKAMLEASPPEKLAPPDTAGFTLVLLAVCAGDTSRLVRAVAQIVSGSAGRALRMLARPLPLPLNKGLSHADALLGQFELVACDCVSVFLADEVAAGARPRYLAALYARLRASPEFEPLGVRIDSIPSDRRGEDYLDKFLGGERCALPVELRVMRKKARIMKHWAEKIGGRLQIVTSAG